MSITHSISVEYQGVQRVEVERYSDGHINIWLWGQGEVESIRITGIDTAPVGIEVTDRMEVAVVESLD